MKWVIAKGQNGFYINPADSVNKLHKIIHSFNANSFLEAHKYKKEYLK